MNIHIKVAVVFAALNSISPQTKSSAQAKLPAEAARAILAARTTDDASGLSRTLTQTDLEIPAATRDAVADTLVAMALGRADVRQELRRTAIHALILSGAPSARVAYPGAGVRLFTIASRAPDAGVRGAALSGITSMANKQEAVKLLHDLALVDNLTSVGAIRELRTTLSELGGGEALRELYNSRAVVNEIAREALADYARRQGWK